MLRIVVIGGGITGTAAAAELARAGQSVTLIEKHRIAAMASAWTLGGVRQSGRDPAELPLARAAIALWSELAHTLGVDVEFRQGGNLRLARTPDEVQVIRQLVENQRALGLDLHFPLRLCSGPRRSRRRSRLPFSPPRIARPMDTRTL
jgi:sarcosine oxidase subunit beta